MIKQAVSDIRIEQGSRTIGISCTYERKLSLNENYNRNRGKGRKILPECYQRKYYTIIIVILINFQFFGHCFYI